MTRSMEDDVAGTVDLGGSRNHTWPITATSDIVRMET